MEIQNAAFRQVDRSQWRPWGGDIGNEESAGLCPVPDSAEGPLASACRAIWQEHAARAGFVEELRAEERDAIDQERAAYEAVQEEERTAVAEMRAPDPVLAERLRIAHEAAGEDVWRRRIQEARSHSRNAAGRLAKHLSIHGLEIARELKLDQEAREAATALAKFEAEVQRKREPLIQRRVLAQNRVEALLGQVAPFRREDISQALTDAPWPSDEAFARHRELHAPALQAGGHRGSDGRGLVA
jgi:hypothetical protein